MTPPPVPEIHGTSKVEPVHKKRSPLLWLLIPLVVLVALGLAKRGCQHDTVARLDGGTMGSATPGVAVKKVVLPGGAALELDPASLNYLLQEYLASSAAVPRTFVFDRLNFGTGSAELPADAQMTVDALAQILKAYPAAKITLDGYADARGSAGGNADLGAKRAQAVATALTTRGIDAGRIATATGGETNPVDTNATAQGRAENRRTELVVTAK
ncbi:MAG TPA: OmpA family protein [Kofleriaceae bacterium]